MVGNSTLSNVLTYAGESSVKWYERHVLPRYIDEDATELIASSWEYIDRGGKRLRPALAYLSCEACGGNSEDSTPWGALIEFFHNMFLTHDDIEDDSKIRRGKPSLHLMYDLPTAVNSGDFLGYVTLRCLRVGRDGWNGRPGWGQEKFSRLFDLAIEMLYHTSLGQGMEIQLRKKPLREISESRVMKILTNKTSYYTGKAPLAGGGIIAGRYDLVPSLGPIGIEIALGFQIQDDVLNACMAPADVHGAPTTEGGKYGKDFFGDAIEGKWTLYAAHLMENASDSNRKEFESMWGNKNLSVDGRIRLQELLQRVGSIDYAKNKSEKMLRNVQEKVRDILPATEARKILLTLLDFFVNRTF